MKLGGILGGNGSSDRLAFIKDKANDLNDKV
jgi:hypothetical protein